MKRTTIMREALRSAFKRPITIRWAKRASARTVLESRGTILYRPEECIGCLLCARMCPSGAIAVKENKKVRFNLGRCLYCGQCVSICPTKAIAQSSERARATDDRETLYVE
ncbi:MAG: 4Fe-4S binding protein [Candidatus Thorarchaeota archaeon]